MDDVVDGVHSYLDGRRSMFILAAEHLKRCEASGVYIVATHGILSGDGKEKRINDIALRQIEECEEVDQVIVTNTYPISEAKRGKKGLIVIIYISAFATKLRVIDVSGVLSEAIRRTHNGESISYLFDEAI